MINDVRAILTPRSTQKLLYDPVSPVPESMPRAARASSPAASRAARSSSVSTSWSAKSSGRSNGVVVVFVQIPWRSGSPHGVRGAWPATSTGISTTTAATANNATRIRWLILPPWLDTLADRVRAYRG